jgi:hypothetical protein
VQQKRPSHRLGFMPEVSHSPNPNATTQTEADFSMKCQGIEPLERAPKESACL